MKNKNIIVDFKIEILFHIIKINKQFTEIDYKEIYENVYKTEYSKNLIFNNGLELETLVTNFLITIQRIYDTKNLQNQLLKILILQKGNLAKKTRNRIKSIFICFAENLLSAKKEFISTYNMEYGKLPAFYFEKYYNEVSIWFSELKPIETTKTTNTQELEKSEISYIPILADFLVNNRNSRNLKSLLKKLKDSNSNIDTEYSQYIIETFLSDVYSFCNKNDSSIKKQKLTTKNKIHNKEEVEQENLDVLPSTEIEPENTPENTYDNTVAEYEVLPNDRWTFSDGYTPDEIVVEDRKAFYSIDSQENHLKEDIGENSIGEVIKGRFYDKTYYENLIFLNKYSLNELQNKKANLLEGFEDKKKETSFYRLNRIYNIKNNIYGITNYFKSLSSDYPDFIKSEHYEKNDYFELIYEFEKGSGTRTYLDLFISTLKEKYLAKGFTEKEIDINIDKALQNWSYDIKDVDFCSPSMAFIDTGFVISHNDEEQIEYMPRDKWFNKRLTFTDNDFLTIKEFMKNEGSAKKFFLRVEKEDIEKLIKLVKNDKELEIKWGKEIFGLSDEDLRKTKAHLGLNLTMAREIEEAYGDSENYKRVVTESEKWIFEYNKKILESKKRAVESHFENNLFKD